MAQGTEVALRCNCGTVRGVAHDVAPSSINHCFCYCDDCQAFAHFLERTDVLDQWGGTEIVQLSQGKVELSAGRDQLAAIRLTDNGLVRWFAGCCRTPLGNTMATSRIPFIGVIRAAIDAPAAVLGPVRGRGFAKSAKGGAAAVPKDGSSDFAMVLRMVPKLIGWRLRGDHKRSALFEAGTDRPLAVPRILSAAEREELRQRCLAWRS